LLVLLLVTVTVTYFGSTDAERQFQKCLLLAPASFCTVLA
jgi:hypothetical protein